MTSMEGVRRELIELFMFIPDQALTLVDQGKNLKRAVGLSHLIGWTYDHPRATLEEYREEEARVKAAGAPDPTPVRVIVEEETEVEIKRAWMQGDAMWAEVSVGGELYSSQLKTAGVPDGKGEVYTREALEGACHEINSRTRAGRVVA